MVTEDSSFNLKLVLEVKKHSCLYNFKNPDYSKKEIVEAAWEKIAYEMDDTEHNCKERWRNLRTVFVRKLKTKTKKRYYLTEAMMFLIPFVRVGKDKSGTIQHNGESGEETEFIYNEEDDMCDATVKAETNYDIIDFSENEITNLTNLTSLVPSSSMNKKRRLSDEEEELNELERPTPEEEACRQFLMSLLPDVNQLNVVQMRKFKRKVLEYIDDLLGETDNDSVILNQSTASDD